MKQKTFIVGILVILSGLVSQAQVKVTPKLTEGMKVVYSTTLTQEDGSPLSTSKEEYVVSQVTPQGAVITVTLLDTATKTDGLPDVGELPDLENTILKGMAIQLAVDNSGKATKVLNIEEMKRKGTELAKALVAEAQSIPDMPDIFPEDLVTGIIEDIFTEQTIIDMHRFNGVLSLNGKTITNGLTEHLSHEGMKLKRVFSVEGDDIVTTSSLDMTKEEQVDCVISQVEKHSPEQAEMFKQNKEHFAKRVNFEDDTTSRYEIDEDGWVKSIRIESVKNMMGKRSKTMTLIQRL